MSTTESSRSIAVELMELAGRASRQELYALPRVITADELKPGQHFASFLPGADIPVFGGQIDRIEGMDDGGLNFTMNGKFARIPSVEKCTIVLLADAPDTKDLNVAKETVKGEYPDNPWFGTVYEDGTHWADTWRGTPVRPQSIRTGDLYDIHTAHGTTITGVVAARNGVRNPQSGDQYRLVNRKA